MKTDAMYMNQQFDFCGLLGSVPGFRLRKLEVYNWGTFDEKVQSFVPNGGTSLLTGESGSGKSTLVDALLTILISPRKIMYNKAADASSKERSVTSYVRGQYGQKKGAEGTGQSESLRSENNYSVILATFYDSGLARAVTLAKVFYFYDSSKPPKPLYVVTENELGIVHDFTLSGGDISALKKRLKNIEGVDVFEDYIHYSEVFSRKLGIENTQALDLFQQTVAMKKVEALTDFVRANMLEDPDMDTEVQKQIDHFQDLNSAHEAVIKSRNQIALLKPIHENGTNRLERILERTQLSDARTALSPWFAKQKQILIVAETEKQKSRIEATNADIQQIYHAIENCEEEIDKAKTEIRNQGGEALENLKAAIRRTREDLDRAQKKRDEYNRHAAEIRLPLPDTIESFLSNLHKFSELKSKEEIVKIKCDKESQTAAVRLDQIDKESTEIREEIDSLRTRSSSIPRAQIEVRRQLCEALDLPDEALPFAGELLEIKAGEQRWEGAIERLLHHFGLSLLVEDQYYRSVMEWVDQTDLNTRLVYYRVQTERQQEMLGRPAVNTLSEKLNIMPDNVFFSWLRKEIAHRFSHICCADAASFRRETNAITMSGQIKTKGGRHEKDDRHPISDRRRYILGFSNHKKIESLDLTARELARHEQQHKDELLKISEIQRLSQQRLNAISWLESYQEFTEIDARSLAQTLEKLQKNRAELEQGNNILATLERRCNEWTKQRDDLKIQYEKLIEQRANIKSKIESLNDDYAAANQIIADAPSDIIEEKNVVIQEIISAAIKEKIFTIINIGKKETDCRTWLDNKIEGQSAAIDKLGQRLAKDMTDFNTKYPDDTREMDANVDSLMEYERMLNGLLRDDLPRFEKRFKELLNENTINQIALFQANLSSAQNTIRRRIEQINKSLTDIDYNDGRYIRLEYEDAYDADIRDFRAQLRACTEGALAGQEDDQYAESKFLQVKLIIERFRGRPGESERDRRWTERVTDVRNWFLFGASERWRETDEEYEHYTDSGGKSGGQKEKLAYMILAASLVYHYGLGEEDARNHSFRFVMIDEAFLKSSDESAKFGLELFKKLDLQLLIVTPLLKIHTIEPYISHVGFVYHDDISHKSALRNLTIDEYLHERQTRRITAHESMD